MSLKVIGMGLICGLGDGPEAVFSRMCEGDSAISEIRNFDTSSYAQRHGGQLPEELEKRLGAFYDDEDRGLAMARHAALQALGLDGDEASPLLNSRRGLVLATNFGPMETLEWSWRERLDTGACDRYTYAPAEDYIRRLARELGCGGPAAQISMSCASGAAAISVALEMISSGRADSVLVAAYDSLSEYCWCGLSNLRTITTDVMRPFDVHRSGTIFSEGAAAILLCGSCCGGEALGWIDGVATANNAFHITAPRAEGEGSREVMSAAMSMAGVPLESYTHVCAHATSTKANDVTESAAIHNIFGERTGSTITVAAHKSQLGHMLGASGLAEAIVTILAMRHSIIPPTINHAVPDPQCMPLDCIPGTARQKEFKIAVTNSAGIGGNNAALVVSRNGSGSAAGNVNPKCGRQVFIRNIGWVLPSGTGSGGELLLHPEWLEGDGIGALEGFSARPYLSSVKGYLDPSGAYFLSACRLALGTGGGTGIRCGLSSVSCYGSPKSAFGFYAQLVQKGARLASPLIFPHGYANTPANLAAIEFGWSGPHMVFYGEQDMREALRFACARLNDGSADEMLAGFCEAFCPAAFPDGMKALSGAVVLHLCTEPSDNDICTLCTDSLVETSVDPLGAVHALGDVLPAITAGTPRLA